MDARGAIWSAGTLIAILRQRDVPARALLGCGKKAERHLANVELERKRCNVLQIFQFHEPAFDWQLPHCLNHRLFQDWCAKFKERFLIDRLDAFFGELAWDFTEIELSILQSKIHGDDLLSGFPAIVTMRAFRRTGVVITHLC